MGKCTINDSELEPMSSKHFAFGFNTTNLRFEYSLLDDEGKLIEFKKMKK